MGFPAGDEFLVVVASFGVLAGDLGESDGVDGLVDLAVPAAVESVSHHSPESAMLVLRLRQCRLLTR